MKHPLFTIALLLLPMLLQAQSLGASLSGQMRLRSELDDRWLTTDEAVLAHLLRTRLRVTAKPTGHITIVAELQDSRFLGSGDPSQGRGTTDVHAEGLDMHQAWGQFVGIFELPIDARMGRQEMGFGNERLVGAAQWANSGRSFDALRLTFRGDSVGLRLDTWGARLSAPVAAPTAAENFYGAWLNMIPVSGVSADLFAMRDDNTVSIISGRDSSLSMLERYTLGTLIKATLGPLDIELEAAAQTGSAAAGDTLERQDIDAFLGSGSVSLLLVPEGKIRLMALGTVLSGDGSAGDDRNETFNTLFGTNHRFYGAMDYFPALSGNRGLVDLSAQISAFPHGTLRVLLEGHHFSPQRDGNGDAFGSEVDLTAWWKPGRVFELSGGVAMFLPGPLLEDRLGDDMRYWAYLAGQWEF